MHSVSGYKIIETGCFTITVLALCTLSQGNLPRYNMKYSAENERQYYAEYFM